MLRVTFETYHFWGINIQATQDYFKFCYSLNRGYKVLVLQRFHGLSDEATEVQIADRFSFLDSYQQRA